MSSKRPSERPKSPEPRILEARALLAARALAATLVLPLALGLLAGCGKEGPPLPPLRYVPATTEDLQVSQQGPDLVLRMSYPSRSTGGLALPDLARIELWSASKALPPTEPSAEPGAASAMPQPLDPRQLDALAELELALAGRDLTEAVHGNQLVFRIPAPQPGEPTAYYYTIRTVVSERDISEYSNQAVIVPRTPPSAPETPNAAPGADGIELRWEAAPAGEGEARPMGFNLYRKDSRSRIWGEPLYTAGPQERSWLDRTARFGETYVYGVSAVLTTSPRIESAPSETAQVVYRDLFPPPTPRGVVALAETGRVRLVWEAVEAPDLAGYHVDRRSDGGGWERRTEEPVSGLEFVDRDLPSGATFTYRVTAVDREGNESTPAAAVTATVR